MGRRAGFRCYNRRAMIAPEGENTAGPVLERVSPSLVPDIKRFLARHRVGVEEIVARGDEESGLPAGRRLTKAYDGLLSALFHAARAEIGRAHV